MESKKGFSTPEEQPHERIHREVARKAASEGIVLLENRENILPLERESAIALYGRGAVRTVKGGTGSGDVNEREDVSVYDGLIMAGFRILNGKWIEEYIREYEEKRIVWRDALLKEVRESERGMEGFFDTYAARPFPAPAGPEPEKEDCDTALYVISRTAGEAADRRNIKGDYYLTDEEEKFLDDLCRLYDKVIVILNTGGILDLSFMDSHKNICGLILLSQAGMEGGNALADILCGNVSPGGHLTDTWCYDYEDYPGASDFSFMNEDLTTEKYEEGIYTGYRYFDSLGIPVRYGFGYGLSYSEFSMEAEEPVFKDGVLSLPVVVTNIGDVPAREVLQVYVSCPQTGLEKEFRRLAGFKKTGVIPADGFERLAVEIPLNLLSSYDEEEAAWVLENGFYGLWCGFSLDKSVLVSMLSLNKRTVIERCRNLCTSEGTIRQFSVPPEEREEINNKWIEKGRSENLPVLEIDGDAIETVENSYDRPDEPDERVRSLVDALSTDKLISLMSGAVHKEGNAEAVGFGSFKVAGGAGDTSREAVADGIPSIATADGPAGLRLDERYTLSDGRIKPKSFARTVEHGFFDTEPLEESGESYYQYCTAFPVGTLLASSWDEELMFEVGKAVGEEMRLFGVDLWLAPGMNIHRNPLCGRNFEYFSEDPLISGKMAAAITRGVQSIKGCGTTIKHFACNNAEDNRFFSDSVLSERCLREIYLKGFEIAVKEAAPLALMSSYNKINGVHSANNRELITNILRDEWGFKGMVMTDWTSTWYGDGCSASGCVKAGNDLIMPGSREDLKDIEGALKEGLIGIDDIKANAYHIVRTILNTAGQDG
ncbi:MAG: glycoside hydrolase family 3 C-terminal domain-containing protein [Lachnospiraceae bacterium]|nr:glycoside hydrolase family 3 C-terminal domain-containing protein [Lachnospiraceae bacterium]